MQSTVRRIGVRFAVLAFVSLAGCVSYEDRPLSPDEGLDRFVARTLDNNELKVYLQHTLPPQVWPLPRWDLSRLTLAAFFFNPELDVVRARWAVAEARTKAASEYPNPTLGLVPGYNTTTGTAASVSPWIVGVALDLPIETAHRRGYRITEAGYLSETARLEIAQMAWTVRHQVREALLDLYAFTQHEQNLSKDLKLAADATVFVQHLLDVGEISILEADQARTQEEQTRIAWLNVGLDKIAAQARLAEAIGVPVESLATVQLDFSAFESLPELPSTEMQQDALLHRADLLAALANYQTSQSVLQAQIARQYPEIQIGPGYEFDQSEDKWSLGLSVTLPVFNRNRGGIAAAAAAREEAAARVRLVQARIIAQVDQGANQYGKCLEKVRTSQAMTGAWKTRRDRLQKMFELGQVVRSDLIEAALELNASLSAQTDARVAALKALGQLEDAMQTAPDLPTGGQNIPIAPTGQTEPARQGFGV